MNCIVSFYFSTTKIEMTMSHLSEYLSQTSKVYIPSTYFSLSELKRHFSHEKYQCIFWNFRDNFLLKTISNYYFCLPRLLFCLSLSQLDMRITNTMMITIKQIYPVKVHINLIFTLIMNKVVQFSDSLEVFNFLILLKFTGSILERVGKALSVGVSRVSRQFQQVSRQSLVRTSTYTYLYFVCI